MAEFERDLGRLEGKLISTDERLTRIEAQLSAVTTTLNDVSAALSEVKGGRKAMIGLLTVAASLGGGITEIVHFVLGAHK